MTDPRELQASDIVQIHAEAFSDALWRVSDTEVEDIGITETFAVTLVSAADSEPSPSEDSVSDSTRGASREDDSRAYAIIGTTADSTAALSEVDGDHEVTVNWNDIELQ